MSRRKASQRSLPQPINFYRGLRNGGSGIVAAFRSLGCTRPICPKTARPPQAPWHAAFQRRLGALLALDGLGTAFLVTCAHVTSFFLSGGPRP
jgi:hypothetical protein